MIGIAELLEKTCVPCEGGYPLADKDIRELEKQIEGWSVVEDHHLEKEFSFDDFRQALDFVTKVGEIAETEGHHPDIFLTYGKVKISLMTHALDGLSENDFILAAKIDGLV